MAGKFEISKRNNGEFQFNLKAGNGQVILTSEGYTTLAACRNGIASVRTHARVGANFERKTAKDGSAYFSLKASNGQSIGKSEMYKTVAARDNGIDSVARHAPDAAIVDTTTA
jgi:uncharacterized protein YegP (UPF0339 family)